MAVIKCSNCENEILDTEIVCPYCDYPVSKTKSEAYSSKVDSALSGETVKIPISTKELMKKLQVNSTVESETDKPDDNKTEEKPDESSDLHSDEKADVKSETEDVADAEAEPVAEETEEPAGEFQTPVHTDAEDEDSANVANEHVSKLDANAKSVDNTSGNMDNTVKISSDNIQSETLRRSLEERRAERAAERAAQKRKDHKLWILAVTIIGIFVIIYLAINIFSQMAGEKLFEKPRENKKAEKEVTSEAQMKELGYEFKSHTLTVIDEELAMQDYEAHEEKPWKEYISGANNLTIADGIETIGSHAFDDLKNVRHITLASSVAKIGDSAFYGCSKLEKVVFDAEKSKLKSIGNYSFTDCKKLTSISFGPELVRIGEGAFKSCENLEKIIITDSVTEIGADAFLGCPNLVIHCNEDSYAYEYATQNGITVELIEKEGDEEEEENETTNNFSTSTQTSSGVSAKPSNSGSAKTETNSSKEEEKPAGSKSPSEGETASASGAQSGTTSAEGVPTAPPTAPPAQQVPTAPPAKIPPSSPNIPPLGGSVSGQGNQPSSGATNVESLLDALGKAQTQEEKDRILQQIQNAGN